MSMAGEEIDIVEAQTILYRAKVFKEKYDSNLVRYRVNGYQEDVICRHFLWCPKKFDDGWHWLTWAFTRHKANGLDWTEDWMSESEFILFKLSNNLEAVKHNG